MAHPEIVAAIAQGTAGAARDVTGLTKGWVLHAIYCAFYAIRPPVPAAYQDRIDEIIRMGGDTDTNAAIAGALLGALFGEAALRAETRTGPNLETVLTVAGGEIPRPARYAARRLDELGDCLAAIFESSAE